MDDDMDLEGNNNSEYDVNRTVVENSDTGLVADPRGLEFTDATVEDPLEESAGSGDQYRIGRNVCTYAMVARRGMNNG